MFSSRSNLFNLITQGSKWAIVKALSVSKKAENAVCTSLPLGIWCQNAVVSTSMRRHHVASTLIRCHFHVMCPLGMVLDPLY